MLESEWERKKDILLGTTSVVVLHGLISSYFFINLLSSFQFAGVARIQVLLRQFSMRQKQVATHGAVKNDVRVALFGQHAKVVSPANVILGTNTIRMSHSHSHISCD